MYAFIHLKLIGNLQGFCQYIMADMLNFTKANYRKYFAVVFHVLGMNLLDQYFCPKNSPTKKIEEF